MHLTRISSVVAAVSAAAFVAAAWAQPVSDGPLKTVGVDQFLAAEAVGGSVVADGLTAMLIDALVRDGHFVVVERSGIATVQAEHMLGATGATNTDSAVKPGQLIGASAIIRGAVIKYEAARKGGGLSVGGFGLGGLLAPQAGVKHQTSEIEIAIRIIDSATGQIVGSYTAKGTAGANTAGVDVVNPKTGLSVGTSAFYNTPIGQAAQDAMADCIRQIVDGMTKVAWSSSIVEASDGRIYVSGGSDRHMRPGMTLAVMHKGKVFTDPTTGQVLDVEMTKVATIKIDDVRERLSVASLVDGTLPARGDIVRLP